MNQMMCDGILMSIEDAQEYNNLKEEYQHYDRLQYIFKIKLNS